MKEFSFHDPYGKGKFYKEESKQQTWNNSQTHSHMRYAIADEGVSILEFNALNLTQHALSLISILNFKWSVGC